VVPRFANQSPDRSNFTDSLLEVEDDVTEAETVIDQYRSIV
jgi:hypothetical protein